MVSPFPTRVKALLPHPHLISMPGRRLYKSRPRMASLECRIFGIFLSRSRQLNQTYKFPSHPFRIAYSRGEIQTRTVAAPTQITPFRVDAC